MHRQVNHQLHSVESTRACGSDVCSNRFGRDAPSEVTFTVKSEQELVKMLADGEIVGDGSWNLTIYVTDLNEKRTMVVKGDMHIGGVMLKLTESFGKTLFISITRQGLSACCLCFEAAYFT